MKPSQEHPQRSPRDSRASGVVVPHAPRWYQRLAAWLVFALLRGLTTTLRYRWTDRSGYFESGPAEPVIFCVWHNRLALTMKAYYDYVSKRNRRTGMAAMVSASKDGALCNAAERVGPGSGSYPSKLRIFRAALGAIDFQPKGGAASAQPTRSHRLALTVSS